jgi:hypothetical protein
VSLVSPCSACEVAADLLFPELTADRQAIKKSYETWLAAMFPGYAKYPLAEHHHTIWRWMWELEKGQRPSALVAILARGAAKSTSAELGVVTAGVRGRHRHVVYVSESQDFADKHVDTIGGDTGARVRRRVLPRDG